jgi:hypothetical protein
MRTTKLKGAEKIIKCSIYLLLYQVYHVEFQVFELILLILLQLNQRVVQHKYELIMNVQLDDMFELLVLDDLILIQHQVLSIVRKHWIHLYLIDHLDDLSELDINQEVYPKIDRVPIIQFGVQLIDLGHHLMIKEISYFDYER